MKIFASVLLAIGCLLAMPYAATAATFTVTSTGDQKDEKPGEGCKTSVSTCTLRAAIEVANESASVVDEIAFDGNEFKGQLADTITLGSLLPAIKDQVSVKGGACATQAGQKGPCAGVEATGLSYGLSVEDTNSVVVEGLAVTGAVTGIRVVNSSQNFIARNNWLGLKLDGGNGTGANTGIWLDPNSDFAIIGGSEAEQGNVFANNSFEGLDVEGASDASVVGNYFGVKADGTTVAANGKNVEITDANGFEATDNEVGTKVEGAAFTSDACDGGCNVIAGGGLSTGINLVGESITGEEPATGPTKIRGNYVGLAADGATLRANGTFDILVGGAEDATVGGESPGEANYIAGGGYGIYLENGEGLKAVGNVIGSAKTGADVTPPGVGVFLLDTNNALPVQVRQNTIRMEEGVGIEVRFGGSEIKENFIEGAEFGIKTTVAPGAAGSNLIEKNVIGDSTVNGLRIEDEGNLVFGNSVYGSGAAGIRLKAPAALLHANKNKIGGNSAERENNIRESGGDAIEIDNTGEEEASQNEIARNRGDSNAGLFIDLIGATTNGGILPPPFATAIQSSSSGTGAEPGATIRVFRKKTAEAGEIESFLGEAVADGSGSWKVTYPGQIPVGTIVAATQTNTAGGTSELSTETSGADPVDPTPPPPPPPPVPQTKITKGPKAKTHATTVKFKFSSSESGSTFECKLDKKPFKPCKSPKTYKKLKPGKHVFKVRATKAGQTDPTAAKRKFKVLE